MKPIQELLQIRKQKGYEIANTKKVVMNGYKWVVPSQNSNKTYDVILRLDKSVCTCPDFVERGLKCKHIFAVEITTSKTLNQDGTTTIVQTKKITYSQNWKAYDKSQIEEKDKFLELLGELIETIPEPNYVFGRPKMPMRDLLFASALKVYTQFSLRRFSSDMRMAKDKGFIDNTPCYSMISKFMRNEELMPLLQKLITLTALPLRSVESQFAIDSSGFRTTRFNEYCVEKHGIRKEHKFIKAHICIGTKTNVITAVKITDENGADCPQFIPLSKETFESGFLIGEMSGDKAYSSRDNIGYIDQIGGTAFIPFKTNATGKPRGKSHKWRDMYHYYMLNRDEFMEHYHKRFNVESTFNMVKSKFNDSLKSTTPIAQFNELLLKLLCHNIVVVIHEQNEVNMRCA